MPRKTPPSKLNDISNRKLLVIGDFMLDTYIYGTVDRISPEAPVPVVAVTGEESMPGGAGNVAHSLVSLGAKAVIAGVCGKDANGNKLRQMLEGLGIHTGGLVYEPRRPTTTKTRITGANQQMIRIDREQSAPLKEETKRHLYDRIETILPHCDGVVVSDYAKGVIDKALMEHVAATARKHNKFLLVDPKTNDFSQYPGATMIKPNKKEAVAAGGVKITDETSLFKSGANLLAQSDSRYIVITCGGDGMALFERDREPRVFPVTNPRRVYDVSGAGDTVLAVIAAAMATGLKVDEALELANIAGSIVVGKPGTAQVTLAEIIAELASGKC